MESDFSDFEKWESRLRGHSVRLKPGRSPFDSEGSHKFMKWSEGPLIDIRDQKAVCFGILDKAL